MTTALPVPPGLEDDDALMSAAGSVASKTTGRKKRPGKSKAPGKKTRKASVPKQTPPADEREDDGEFMLTGLTTEDFESFETDIRSNMFWVFDHLALDDVQPADAPSPGAYFLWRELRCGSKKDRQDFYKTIYAKLMPSRAQLDKADQMQDKGQGVVELIEKLKAVIAKGREE